MYKSGSTASITGQEQVSILRDLLSQYFWYNSLDIIEKTGIKSFFAVKEEKSLQAA